MAYLSPLEMLYKWEKTIPDNIYLSQPIDDVWHDYSFKQAAEEIRKMAAALKALNLPPKSNIAMLSKNCAHWIMADLAIMMSGHVSVPLYPNLTAESIKQILDHSGAKVLFVGKLDGFEAMKPGIPEGTYCISFPKYGPKGYDKWEDLVAKQAPLKENVIRDGQDTATIIYTSGTTGTPKGVMLNYHSFSFTTTNALTAIHFDNSTRFFSYLPLSHIAERFLVEMGSIYAGAHVFFAESLDKFPKNLQYAKPTVFLAVPRIWTKFQQGILTKMSQKKLNLFLSIPILSSLVKKKIKKGLGLEEASTMISGAAPIPKTLIEWFEKVGIVIQEAYAMTENCCYSHVTLINHRKVGSVGQALPKCDVKIGKDDEVLIKHEGLMSGYYKDPALTAESFTKDGYLRTGDTGEIDKDGFLKITGRCKDLFKTSKAKYVAPAPIELKLSANSDMEQICVVGSGLPQPIALAIVSETGRLKSKEELKQSLAKTLEIVNERLDDHEVLKKIIVMKDAWTVENGLITPTMKVKRNVIDKTFALKYEKWYEQNGAVVWEN